MPVDKSSGMPLYRQVAESIRQQITSGDYPPGSALPTEEALCRLYGVSRFPMRQAMSMLVGEGLLCRTRGKGTYVNHPDKVSCTVQRGRMLALVLPAVIDGFHVDLLGGFERAAARNGYGTLVAQSHDPAGELACLENACDLGAAGIVVFPVDDTQIGVDTLDALADRGVYISIIDRNPGFDHIDYIGSDNNGGGYLAARHMHQHGYDHTVFVSEVYPVSSVAERLNGFRRGLAQYGMTLLNDAAPGALPSGYAVDDFICRLQEYQQHAPFSVFAENDATAIKVMDVLQQHGLTVGDDVGLIGFDNTAICRHLAPPLTTIEQNGALVGETAAELAIHKMEAGSKQSVRHILPTQLIARSSCGEKHTHDGQGGNA